MRPAVTLLASQVRSECSSPIIRPTLLTDSERELLHALSERYVAQMRQMRMLVEEIRRVVPRVGTVVAVGSMGVADECGIAEEVGRVLLAAVEEHFGT